jgi:hypothetical protein
MENFMNSMLNQASDGTQDGDLGVIPKDWNSESVYQVNFIENKDCTEGSSVNDGLLYITDASDLCKQFNVKAKLFDASGKFQQGTISSQGEWTLT